MGIYLVQEYDKALDLLVNTMNEHNLALRFCDDITQSAGKKVMSSSTGRHIIPDQLLYLILSYGTASDVSKKCNQSKLQNKFLNSTRNKFCRKKNHCFSYPLIIKYGCIPKIVYIGVNSYYMELIARQPIFIIKSTINHVQII